MESAAKSVLEHLDEMFPIVRASELKLEDEFMQHTPIGWTQKRVMNTLVTNIPLGVLDFRLPRVDPSFNDKGELVFEEGKKPGVGRLDIEWKIIFEKYLPEKHSCMVTDIEYDLFCGVYIKELVAKGYNVARVWYEVCNESCKHGHFWDSHGAKDTFELTGSRPQGIWCDLGNTRKIITNKDGSIFFTVSGAYEDSSQNYAIASMEKVCYRDYTAKLSTGLMRMDV